MIIPQGDALGNVKARCSARTLLLTCGARGRTSPAVLSSLSCTHAGESIYGKNFKDEIVEAQKF
jgi:hypothetical protein